MSKFCAVIIMFVVYLHPLSAMTLDTLFVREETKEINVNERLAYFEDVNNRITIDSLLDQPSHYPFIGNASGKILNVGFSTSTYWGKLVIKNTSGSSRDFILSVSNPDLDHVNFYEVIGGVLKRTVETGELHDVNTRDVYHRDFLFRLALEPREEYVIYLSAYNNGHSFFIPLEFKEKRVFDRSNLREEITSWLIFGLLIFIMVFNIYLYRITKDKANLYYVLYVFFATVTLYYYDGYTFLYNPPVFVEKLKWLIPGLYIVFFLSFTQKFADNSVEIRKLKGFLNLIKVMAVVSVGFYSLKHPWSLVSDIGISLMLVVASLILIIVISNGLVRKIIPHAGLLLAAYSLTFIGFIILMLKEQNIISTNYYIENSLKFAQAAQCILLTIAVLEKFRRNLEEANHTIKNNLTKIEFQNRELEIINIELEKLSIVASETDNSIAIYDREGRIEWGNEGFEKLYEANLNELIRSRKDKIEDIIPNGNIKRYIDKCFTSKLPIMFETEVQLGNRKRVWIQTTLSPYIRGNELEKIIAIDSDITNLKEYEKELEDAKEKAVESDKLKTAFLGNLSHEIRTPLNGILGFSELLNRTELNEDERKIYLDIIKSSGEQLMHIIDDIVDISLIESNQLKIYHAEFDLKALLMDVMEFFRSYKTTINKAHIDLQSDIRIDEQSSHIVSDSFRVRQILTNLIRNAFKFTHEGFIRISSYTKDKYLYFCVEDSGIGITADKKDIIFQRFRQGEESLSRKYGGTGLGLSISKGILEKMGGRIWLDTTYQPGFRILFSVPLIISKNKSMERTASVPENSIGIKLENKNILVVEDHDVSYKYLEEILLPYKVNLTWATNGLEAVSMVRQENFDLILMDINLPEMDGVAATKEIRKIRKNVPIFVQTAHAMESEIKNIMSSGCNDMIGKPFSEKEFFEKLAKVI